jgi:hypothetical protein
MAAGVAAAERFGIQAVTSTGCSNFSGYGFWDGGSTFKIRSAFPAGRWLWEVSCTGSSNGVSCADDPIFTYPGNYGVVEVADDYQMEPDLLERGFPKISGSDLVYGDGAMKFFWQADTAWLANGVDRANNDRWSSFLADRRLRGFSVVLLDPWAGGAPDSATAGHILFDDLGFDTSTQKCAGHTTQELTWPKTCSRWKPAEWEKLDEKIRLANEQGLVVLLAGVMDPLGNPSGGPAIYPEAEAAQTLARNLAARLSGSAVIFSPSFDDRYATTSALIDAVGTTLSASAPRQLVTAHLAGASSSDDYIGAGGVHTLPWHDLEAYQSGHAFNLAACGADNQYQCAVRRAREMSSLISAATPLKPTFNAEAAYDNTLTEAQTQQIDSPYGVRHTGYNTTLNGADGPTLGVKGLWDWSDPTSSAALNSKGTQEMEILGDQFRGIPWSTLRNDFALIKNQPAEQDKKASMSSWGEDVMIYMPNNISIDVDLSKPVRKGFSCTSSSWTIVWMDPKNGQPGSGGICGSSSVGGATHRLSRPDCGLGQGPTGGCDWLVTIRKTGSSLAAASVSEPALAVWAEPGTQTQAGVVKGRLKGPNAESLSLPFEVGGENPGASALLPVVANLPGHAFLVVWETTFDGHLHGVRGQRISSTGNKTGEPFAVNTTTAYDQSSPWVAASPGSGGLVTWTSYAQDSDQGGIFARRIGHDGLPEGPEIQVNEYTIGRQDLSRVVVTPSGNFVVAWTSWGQDGDDAGVYARRLDRKGNALGSEFRVNQVSLGAQTLVDLSVEPNGDLTVLWDSQGPAGDDQGLFERRYGADGMALGGEVLVVPPTPEELVPAWPEGGVK